MRSITQMPALTVLALSAALGASAPAAAAATTPTEQITMNWTTPYVSSAPWNGNGTGGFSASGALPPDGGDLSVAFHLGAASSHAGSIETISSERTLTGTFGAITLQCDGVGNITATNDPIPITEHCTVIGGTGTYATLHGQGQVSGTVDLSGPTNAVFSEVLKLSTP